MIIEIALDDYDDIFSDFDIREFDERIVSIDFMEEVLRRIRRINTCPKKLQILLTVPKYKRRKKVERVVRGRILDIFKQRFSIYSRRIDDMKRKGFIHVFIGLAILIITYAIHESIFSDFLLVPSWFFTWNGLDILINELPSFYRKRDIFSCLSNAKIVFKNEEDVYED